MVKLPKATYTTDLAACASSQDMHASSSGRQKCPTTAVLLPLPRRSPVRRGPTGTICGKRANVAGSAPWKELQRTKSHLSTARMPPTRYRKSASCPSWLPMQFHASWDVCITGMSTDSWNVPWASADPALSFAGAYIDYFILYICTSLYIVT
ncbi:hypothetical protein Zm00014a_029073 [Zea mays]|uniref:Uncharacterized protein n=1 Tax=Zea mays TaxID=4577 RepID=A0A3L6EWI0_MAIZE|nr:hypothetical protein Zm00014a_029073 [Zea mays]